MNRSLAFLLLGLFALSACDSAPDKPLEPPRRHFSDAQSKAYADKQFAVYDPAEPLNKRIYTFNAGLDEYVLIPIVDAYKFVTPEFLRTGVSNFFLNVGEVTNFTNAVFQLNPDKAGITLGRFAVNTTVGLLGTFDVATQWDLKRQPEDFGKTLGHWGVPAGAYVVLPFLGPSSVRDTVGQVADYATLAVIIPHDVQESTAYDVAAYGLRPLDLRYSNGFRYYDSGSPFEYEIVRYITTQTRSMQIEKEKQH